MTQLVLTITVAFTFEDNIYSEIDNALSSSSSEYLGSYNS